MRLRAITAMLACAALAAGLVAAAPAASSAVAPRPIVSGWLGWWASDTVITEMIAEADGVVGEVAMFWWSFQGRENPLCLYDNGNYNGKGHGAAWCDSSTPWTTPKFDRQRKMLQEAGIKVHASITDLSSAFAGDLSQYISKPKNRRQYAAKITRYAVSAGVDGIDLDWENFAFNDDRATWEKTRGYWVSFIKELSTRLHAEGLTLWATVPGGAVAFSGDGSPYDSTGYWVYAWKQIAPHIDRLNIMAYDYSWSVPGPIGPNDWANRVAASAVAQVGKENAGKVWVGSPQYGRDWPVAATGGWRTKEGCPEGWKPNTAPTKKTEMGGNEQRLLAQRLGVKPTWNERYGEWTFQYWEETKGKVGKKRVTCEVLREVWFADAKSALARASIVPEHEIGGIVVWQFDYVAEDFYAGLAEYGRTIAPAATEVTVKAPKAAAYGRTVSVKVSTDSSAGPAKESEATLYFAPKDGSAARSEVGTITLDGTGSGTFTVPVEESGSWTVAVSGTWARKSGESDPVETSVRYGVTAKASATKVSAGTQVVITGAVSPGAAGTAVSLQRRTSSGSWRNVASTTTGAGGSVSVTVKPGVPGQISYRLVVPASSGMAQGWSTRIVLTVT